LNAFGQLATVISVENLIVLAGIAVFSAWLLDTSLGRRALVQAPTRRNRMLPLTPMIPFFVWFVGTASLQWAVEELIGTLGGWQGQFLDHLLYGIGAAVTVVLILIIARMDFARGLKGFGLRLHRLPRDAGCAFVTLLAVWPVVLGMIHVTMEVMKIIYGQDFEIPKHPQLELMTESPPVPLQVLLVVLAVVVAPLVEELLFRGMFQTLLRSYLDRPWVAIFVTSALFASVHLNRTHWPALFALGVGLGYAYEKSGSLWRPIFMHALFNGVSVIATLAQEPGVQAGY